MALIASVVLGLALAASPVRAGLEEIDHVVLFMQENRAWNHVRGAAGEYWRARIAKYGVSVSVLRKHGRRERIQRSQRPGEPRWEARVVPVSIPSIDLSL